MRRSVRHGRRLRLLLRDEASRRSGEGRVHLHDDAPQASGDLASKERRYEEGKPMDQKLTAQTLTTRAEVAPGLRDRELPQYSIRQIFGVWAAVTVPMGILAWVVAPWMSHRIGGRDPFIDSLLICFNVGLTWMVALVLILVRKETGSLAWTSVRDALWLRAPRDPKSKRVGGLAMRAALGLGRDTP